VQPFIAWDGEGVANVSELDYLELGPRVASAFAGELRPYALFGASTGERIKYVDLSKLHCLELIIQVGRKHKGIHVSFSFGYDVNMILKDLDVRALYVLRSKGYVFWNGYHIEHIPRKWLVVRYRGITVKIFDVFLFFNCAFGKALRKYSIGDTESLDRIDKGKEERPNFTWDNIDEIETYWETELDFLVSLMDRLRSIIYGAGYKITSWHGPGALASYALRIYGTDLHMDRGSSDEIIDAARYAMFGGRFNGFMCGYYDGSVHERDINSAYAYAFSRLPSLSTGTWRHDACPNRADARHTRMGLYRIRYTGRYSGSANPLPHRSRNGRVSFPPATEGWFHAPEAAIVSNDPNAEFLEAWIYEDDGTYPFAWILEVFEERLKMQGAGDPSEKAIKWMLAALYGQAAQRAGWERKQGPPKWHQLEWAGAVTSECRAMIYSASKRAKQSLVSIDTDGFISLAPVNILPNGCGDRLGEWKKTTHTGLLYLQNGIYWTRDSDGIWQPPKSRGIPRKKLNFSDVLPLMLQNENLTVSQHMFIGYGLALRGQMEKWRHWVDVPRTVTFGGNGKSQHIPEMCGACKDGKSWGEAMHVLIPAPVDELKSHPYDLPWLHNSSEAQLLKDWTEVDEREDAGLLSEEL
jgi:hypothetical protein